MSLSQMSGAEISPSLVKTKRQKLPEDIKMAKTKSRSNGKIVSHFQADIFSTFAMIEETASELLSQQLQNDHFRH